MREKLVRSSDIELGIKANNWEEAISAAGEIMVRNGHVTAEYVRAMQQAVNELGPYIVIAPGLAMPHANSAQGVKQSAISIITLESPVAFGHKANDPVHMIVGVAGMNDGQHMDIIQAIASVFEEEGALAALLKMCDKETIAEIFNRSIEAGREV
ncbi:MAG: PTS sugar transporter subunit IIA [Candidatus Pelethousia sp.]|nr:PTS sugar transporter subunit IIA [Candidatus Pelethousia sp.]